MRFYLRLAATFALKGEREISFDRFLVGVRGGGEVPELSELELLDEFDMPFQEVARWVIRALGFIKITLPFLAGARVLLYRQRSEA